MNINIKKLLATSITSAVISITLAACDSSNKTDAAKEVTDKAMDAGKEMKDKAMDAGKEIKDKAMDAGKE